MTRYQHTQIGHAIVWSLLAIILIVNGGLGHHAPPLAVSIMLLVCLILFYRLNVTIDDEMLCASFGPGIIRKRVPLADIVSCEPIRIRWWYGWGIHVTPCGWLYNVSGFDGWRSRCAMAENWRSALMIRTGSLQEFETQFASTNLRI